MAVTHPARAPGRVLQTSLLSHISVLFERLCICMLYVCACMCNYVCHSTVVEVQGHRGCQTSPSPEFEEGLPAARSTRLSGMRASSTFPPAVEMLDFRRELLCLAAFSVGAGDWNAGPREANPLSTELSLRSRK